MPSEKVLGEKKAYVSELKEKISKAVSCVVVDYKGINVEEDTSLRRDMRKANVDYFVVKNRLLKLALEGGNYEKICEVLEGTTAIALSNEDAIAGAKILGTYAAKHKEFFSIKAGFMENEVYDGEQMTKISKIPPKEVLIATLLAGFNSPIQKFTSCLDQIAKQKSA